MDNTSRALGLTVVLIPMHWARVTGWKGGDVAERCGLRSTEDLKGQLLCGQQVCGCRRKRRKGSEGAGGGLFKANAVNEEDFECDRATLVWESRCTTFLP